MEYEDFTLRHRITKKDDVIQTCGIKKLMDDVESEVLALSPFILYMDLVSPEELPWGIAKMA